MSELLICCCCCGVNVGPVVACCGVNEIGSICLEVVVEVVAGEFEPRGESWDDGCCGDDDGRDDCCDDDDDDDEPNDNASFNVNK